MKEIMKTYTYTFNVKVNVSWESCTYDEQQTMEWLERSVLDKLNKIDGHVEFVLTPVAPATGSDDWDVDINDVRALNQLSENDAPVPDSVAMDDVDMEYITRDVDETRDEPEFLEFEKEMIDILKKDDDEKGKHVVKPGDGCDAYLGVNDDECE